LIEISDLQYLFAMKQSAGMFQAHRHTAWDESVSFGDRISDLPLYALEFNNPDRDGDRQGPTVAHYSPARREIVALAKLCRALGQNVAVLDVGCGNGFIGSLLAREGVRVIGIDDDSWKPPQIATFFDADTYERRAPCSLGQFAEPFDVALCSWMVPGTNLTRAILTRRPSLVIHVYSSDRHEDGSITTGSAEAYDCPPDYAPIGRWTVVTPHNFFAKLGFPTGTPRKTRLVEAWRRQDVQDLELKPPELLSEEYSWQIERDRLNEICRRLGTESYEVPVAS
jgi:SAM-dependent methyltransferase